MPKNEHIELRFTGGRFESHALPFSFFKELSTFEELLYEIGKKQFLDQNPDRQRVPRNFRRRFELVATNMKPGSVELTIQQAHLPQKQQTTLPDQTHILEAFHIVQNVIANPERVDDTLTAPALTAFEKFGSSLTDDEAIVFINGSGKSSPTLTQEIRREILLRRTEDNVTTKNTVEVGRVVRADGPARTIDLDFNGRKIALKLSKNQLQNLGIDIAELDNVWVRVEGLGRFDQNERLLDIEDLMNIEKLESDDPIVQTLELQTLKDGWLDGEGRAPTNDVIRIAMETIDTLPDDAPVPTVFPTGDGGILFEWLLDRWDISLEFDPDTQRASWHQYHLDTDDERTSEFPFNGPYEERAKMWSALRACKADAEENAR